LYYQTVPEKITICRRWELKYKLTLSRYRLWCTNPIIIDGFHLFDLFIRSFKADFFYWV